LLYVRVVVFVVRPRAGELYRLFCKYSFLLRILIDSDVSIGTIKYEATIPYSRTFFTPSVRFNLRQFGFSTFSKKSLDMLPRCK